MPLRDSRREFNVSYSTILRMDKEVLRNDIPKPKTSSIQGIPVDAKFLESHPRHAGALMSNTLRQVRFLRLQRDPLLR